MLPNIFHVKKFTFLLKVTMQKLYNTNQKLNVLLLLTYMHATRQKGEKKKLFFVKKT